jgi:hypothetical protein
MKAIYRVEEGKNYIAKWLLGIPIYFRVWPEDKPNKIGY